MWTNTDYKFTTDTIQGYRRKLYISSVDSLQSGLFLSPLINPRQANKLSVVTLKKTDPDATRELLLSIRLK
ncbi:MAG: hypothetical protein IPO92_24165 [Saprospiraceae bacterium]|nr:hypothetical protein [Saprospiraceae bacterium]